MVQPETSIKIEDTLKSETVVDSVLKEERIANKDSIQSILTPADDTVLKTPLQFNKIGDTILSAAIKARAENLAELIQRYPHLNLQIEGHTCDMGNETVNRKIGLSRANAVTMYLQQKGIDLSRMRVESKWSSVNFRVHDQKIGQRQQIIFHFQKARQLTLTCLFYYRKLRTTLVWREILLPSKDNTDRREPFESLIILQLFAQILSRCLVWCEDPIFIRTYNRKWVDSRKALSLLFNLSKYL